jgi:hypothetical protein
MFNIKLLKGLRSYTIIISEPDTLGSVKDIIDVVPVTYEYQEDAGSFFEHGEKYLYCSYDVEENKYHKLINIMIGDKYIGGYIFWKRNTIKPEWEECLKPGGEYYTGIRG